MDLLNTLMKGAQGGAVDQLGRKFGLDGAQTQQALGAIMPALAGGLQKNTQSADGLAGLTKALQSGGHQRYLDEPESLDDSGAIADGNGVLGHLLGSKDASRALADQTQSSTGIDAGIIKQMLPLVASMVMGGLSKETNDGSALAESTGSNLLGSLLGGADIGGLDDLAGMAGKLGKFLK